MDRHGVDITTSTTCGSTDTSDVMFVIGHENRARHEMAVSNMDPENMIIETLHDSEEVGPACEEEIPRLRADPSQHGSVEMSSQEVTQDLSGVHSEEIGPDDHESDQVVPDFAEQDGTDGTDSAQRKRILETDVGHSSGSSMSDKVLMLPMGSKRGPPEVDESREGADGNSDINSQNDRDIEKIARESDLGPGFALGETCQSLPYLGEPRDQGQCGSSMEAMEHDLEEEPIFEIEELDISVFSQDDWGIEKIARDSDLGPGFALDESFQSLPYLGELCDMSEFSSDGGGFGSTEPHWSSDKI